MRALLFFFVNFIVFEKMGASSDFWVRILLR